MAGFLITLLTLLATPWLLFAGALRAGRGTTPRRVLVIQLGKIGDLVCTTPLFRSLHDAGDHVTVLCMRGAKDVLLHNPCVQEVIAHDEEQYRGFLGRIRLLRRLYRTKFDASAAVLPGALNAIYGLWAAAPLRLHTRGGTMGIVGRFFHECHTLRQTYARGTRTFDHYMRIAAALGGKPVPYRHEIHLTSEEEKAGDLWLTAHGLGETPFIVYSLTAGNHLKEWPLEKFLGVAEHAHARHGCQALFSSMAVHVTSDAARKFGSGRGIDGGGLSLRVLAAVIRRARAFVSVDTGPLYIAHALSIPLVDIVGPVDAAEQPPVPGPGVQLVLPDPPVAPTTFVAETLRVPTEEQRKAIENTSVEAVNRAIDKLFI